MLHVRPGGERGFAPRVTFVAAARHPTARAVVRGRGSRGRCGVTGEVLGRIGGRRLAARGKGPHPGIRGGGRRGSPGRGRRGSALEPVGQVPAAPRGARRVRTAVRTGSDRLTEAAPVTLSRDRRPKRAAWVLAPIPPEQGSLQGDAVAWPAGDVELASTSLRPAPMTARDLDAARRRGRGALASC